MELTTQLLCLKTDWPQKQVSLFMQRVTSYMERSRNKMVMRVLKNLPANAEGVRDTGSISGWGRPPRGRHRSPPSAFLPEDSHRQRTLAGYSHGIALSRT